MKKVKGLKKIYKRHSFKNKYKKIINYCDVDKLDENDNNHLYNIVKKFHITELFENQAPQKYKKRN